MEEPKIDVEVAIPKKHTKTKAEERVEQAPKCSCYPATDIERGKEIKRLEEQITKE